MVKKTVDKVKKFFLISMISLFIIAGIFGAVFFLVGSFNEVALRIFLTIGSLFIFSLFGLASAKLLKQKEPLNYLAIAGLVFASIALILILPVIWDLWNFNETTGKITIIVSIWAMSIAQASLISGKMKNKLTKISYYSTLVLITIVASLLTFVVIGEVDGDWFWRLLGFFGILDVSGTIVTPLMRRLKG